MGEGFGTPSSERSKEGHKKPRRKTDTRGLDTVIYSKGKKKTSSNRSVNILLGNHLVSFSNSLWILEFVDQLSLCAHYPALGSD